MLEYNFINKEYEIISLDFNQSIYNFISSLKGNDIKYIALITQLKGING